MRLSHKIHTNRALCVGAFVCENERERERERERPLCVGAFMCENEIERHERERDREKEWMCPSIKEGGQFEEVHSQTDI